MDQLTDKEAAEAYRLAQAGMLIDARETNSPVEYDDHGHVIPSDEALMAATEDVLAKRKASK